MNNKESPSDQATLRSPSVPKQTLFYFQITHQVIQSLKTASGFDDGSPAKLITAAVEAKILEYVDRYSFGTGGAGKLMLSLVKYSIFLQSQGGEKPVSESLLKAIKTKADAAEGETNQKYKRFLHVYLCFACQLCYHKPV